MKKPISINDLIAKSPRRLGALQTGAEAALKTLAATHKSIAPELAAHIFGASLAGESPKTLTLLVDSSAFATRVRYALPAALPIIVGELGLLELPRTQVRVRPRQ